MIRTLCRSLLLPVALVAVWGAVFVLAASATPPKAHASELRDGRPHVVFQCDAPDHGIRSLCERFYIPAHPKVGELGEATATHRYEVETCTVVVRHGDAYLEACSVRFVPKGDQIIRRHR